MKRKLGEILLAAGVVTKPQLDEALRDQQRYGGKLGTILLERRMITEREFFQALTTQLRIPAVDFSRSTVPEAVLGIVPQELAEKHVVFPVALKQTPKGKILILAMADPTNVGIQDEIQFTTGYKVEPALALDSTIRYVIHDYFSNQLGHGAYRLKADYNNSELSSRSDGATPPDGATRDGMMIEDVSEVEYERIPERPAPSPQPTPPAEPASADNRPNLSRELRTLLKLLAKKGILTPKEYLEEFNNTE